MPRPSKPERDRHQKGSIAEEFQVSKENRWQRPTLEKEYWKDPNHQKGCSALQSSMERESMKVHEQETGI